MVQGNLSSDFALLNQRRVQFKEGTSRVVDSLSLLTNHDRSEYLNDAITPEDVVWTFSGVRPLYNDGASQAQEATRDYVVRENNELGGPLINVFGGKITTYRKLAEDVVARVCNYLGQPNQPWTSGTRLPGGHFPVEGFEDLVSKIKQDYA